MLLRTENISKQFNGIYALKGIDMDIQEGEIHGLVGENGAGKSTLIKILTGVYSLDEGTVYWNDQPVAIHTPTDSRKIGINVIHQDHVLIPAFNAVENVYLGMEYPSRGGTIDWKQMKERVQHKAQELGIEIDLTKAASQLSPPQKTCLEIIRAMMTDCRLLILDEPTASLTDKESEILFGIIDRLKQRGTSILYVTHRMDEIFRLTDRITIFKNGIKSGVVGTKDVDKEGLISLMTEQWKAETVDKTGGLGPVQLEVREMASKDGIVKRASLQAHSGEILGIFGLGGSGRTELLECIYGYRTAKCGTVSIDGKKMERLSPGCSIREGMVLICEDRRGKAMIGSMSIKENVTLSCIDEYSSHGVLSAKKEEQAVSERVGSLQIKMAGMDQRAIELSGGNQQKVVFAKALMTNPKVFLCDEPTQAVDVKTRNEIHKLLRERAAAGSAVVYVSSDLKEILEVADNIMIMSRGCTKELLKNENLTSNEVLSYCYDK